MTGVCVCRTRTAVATPDTGVVVAALRADHPHRERAIEALRSDGSHGLVDHVLLEAFSVLTRMPGRAEPRAVASLLRRWRPAPVLSLPAPARDDVPERLATAGVAGGATYDGLIALTAAHHDVELLSLDRRAARTYRALGARFRLL